MLEFALKGILVYIGVLPVFIAIALFSMRYYAVKKQVSVYKVRAFVDKQPFLIRKVASFNLKEFCKILISYPPEQLLTPLLMRRILISIPPVATFIAGCLAIIKFIIVGEPFVQEAIFIGVIGFTWLVAWRFGSELGSKTS
jgi:hypothetical protein